MNELEIHPYLVEDSLVLSHLSHLEKTPIPGLSVSPPDQNSNSRSIELKQQNWLDKAIEEKAYTALLQSYHELNSNHVDELASEPSPLEFMRYVSRNRPFVVREAAKQWPALSHWNTDYLKKRMGDQLVNIAVTPHGNADAAVQREGNAKEYIFVQPSEEQQPFSQFIDELTASKDGDVVYAQSQNDNLRNEYLSIFPDVLPDIDWARIALQQEPEAINVWIGSERSITSLHKDNYENVYVQIIGQKHFTLLPPIAGPCVNDTVMPQGRYTRDVDGWHVEDLKEAMSIPVAIWDPDMPEQNANSLAHLARPLRVTLDAGDMLYLPNGWYHRVSQTCGNEGICVAVNYWYDMDFEGSLHPTTTFVREVMTELSASSP